MILSKGKKKHCYNTEKKEDATVHAAAVYAPLAV